MAGSLRALLGGLRPPERKLDLGAVQVTQGLEVVVLRRAGEPARLEEVALRLGPAVMVRAQHAEVVQHHRAAAPVAAAPIGAKRPSIVPPGRHTVALNRCHGPQILLDPSPQVPLLARETQREPEALGRRRRGTGLELETAHRIECLGYEATVA